MKSIGFLAKIFAASLVPPQALGLRDIQVCHMESVLLLHPRLDPFAP